MTEPTAVDRIVVAYDGGMSTSAALHWLQESTGADIVALIVGLGQPGSLDEVRSQALTLGAARAHVIDARDSFARDFVLPALQAGALGGDADGVRALALSRAQIVHTLVDVARIEGASRLLHGALHPRAVSRLERLVRDASPAARLLHMQAGWRTIADAAAWLQSRGASVKGRPSDQTDGTLWGSRTRIASRDADGTDPSSPASPLRAAVESPALVEITVEEGVPASINSVAMPLVELIESLDVIAASHDIGMASLSSGAGAPAVRVRAPAAAVLTSVYTAVRRELGSGQQSTALSESAGAFAAIIDEGRWFTAERRRRATQAAELYHGVRARAAVELSAGVQRVLGVTLEASRESFRPASLRTAAASS